MASVKLATLIIRTVAKPISNQLKAQAKQHEMFRNVCVSLAQRMYRGEIQLRTRLLGEPAKHVRPLSETKAIENGANALAEGFLFAVAASLILAETWRSARSQSKRRDDVDDRLDELAARVDGLTERVDGFMTQFDERWGYEQQKNDELARILERVVEIGMRGGWAEFERDPVQLPRISLARTAGSSSQTPSRDIPPSDTEPPENSQQLSSVDAQPGSDQR